jgi:uncharacterized protein
MKLSLDGHDGAFNTIRGYARGQVQVNSTTYGQSLIVTPGQIVADWPPQSLDELTPDHLSQVAALEPEIVLLGTGQLQRFPHPALLASLMRVRIGVEVMDTAAACRTYNIIMAEGRAVAAALFMI